MNVEKISKLCRALSVDTRVRIVDALRNGPLCVGALTCRLGITQSAVSQHLRVLKEAGIVRTERRGNFIHYQLNDSEMQNFINIVGNMFLDRGGDEPIQDETKGGEHSCVAKRKNAKSPRT